MQMRMASGGDATLSGLQCKAVIHAQSCRSTKQAMPSKRVQQEGPARGSSTGGGGGSTRQAAQQPLTWHRPPLSR